MSLILSGHTSFVDGIPVWLQCQVAMENARLEEERYIGTHTHASVRGRRREGG